MKKQLLIAFALLVAYQAETQTWVTQNVNPINEGYDFICMSSVDNLTAMGIGSSVDRVYPLLFLSRTVDGGNSWVSFALDPDLFVNSLDALSADTAWIATINLSSGMVNGNWYASLYKTADGGQTWDKNLSIPFDSTSYVDMMHFFDSNNGVAFGDIHEGKWEVYYTSDGGSTWNNSSIPSPLNTEMCLDNHFCTFGDNIWITSNLGRIYHSANKGANWTVSQVGAFGWPIICRAAFYDALEGIAVSYDFNTSVVNNIYRTYDAGATWNIQSFTGNVYQNWGESCLFIVPGRGVVFSNGGSPSSYGSSYSADGGLTWIDVDLDNRYGAMDGKDWNSLWTGQYSSIKGTGGVAKWDGLPLGMTTNEDLSGFLVAPNPSDGKFAIEINNHKNSNLTISITNITGQIVDENTCTKTDDYFIHAVDLKNPVAGVYFVKVFDGEKNYCKKMIVERCH